MLTSLSDGTPVNISLMHGPADNMQFVRNITVNNLNSTFTWNPHDSNPSGNYALVIHQGAFSLSSPRFALASVIAHVPASVSAVVTLTSVTTNPNVVLAPSDLPKIVVVGREATAAPLITHVPHPAYPPDIQNRGLQRPRADASASAAASLAAAPGPVATLVVALNVGRGMGAPSVFSLLGIVAGMVAFV